MARKTSTVPANRFQTAAVAEPQRLGHSKYAPGWYTNHDDYGFHLLRVLPDAQEILYTVTKGGMGVEKINFVPSKDRRDGNAAYGNRWLNILTYRQGEDHAADFAVLVENGLKMAPEGATATQPTNGFKRQG